MSRGTHSHTHTLTHAHTHLSTHKHTLTVLLLFTRTVTTQVIVFYLDVGYNKFTLKEERGYNMTTLYAMKTATTTLNKVPYTATVLISEKAKDVLFNDEEIPAEVTRTLVYDPDFEYFHLQWIERSELCIDDCTSVVHTDAIVHAELAYLVNAHNGEFVIDPKYPIKRITESEDVVAPS